MPAVSDAGGQAPGGTGAGASATPGQADPTPGAGNCDAGLVIDSPDPRDGARALGLCRFVTEASGEPGVIDARYVSADGSRVLDDLRQVGLLDAFGVNPPLQGTRMLALSSGSARAPGQPGYSDNCGEYFSDGSDRWPPGYPRESSACPSAPEAISLFDPAALQLRLRVPEDARAMSFRSNYFTFEYPSYICSEYNDYFVTFVDPPAVGQVDTNVVFDEEGNWISVNTSLLQVCSAGTHGGRVFDCPLGTERLVGTGYEGGTLCASDGGASTGWLRTRVAVTGGQVLQIRFAIWDSDDVNRDSLVLIDDLQFEQEAAGAPETTPVEII